MHGFLGTSSSMQRKTRFDELAKRHGFIVIYPNGKRRRWNDGRSSRNTVDDVGYLTALIKAQIEKGIADPNRIFLAGHSNGGGMAMRMACDKPDLVRGIAVVATKTPTAFQCARGAAVPAVFFHGTEDPIAPHNGRPSSSRLGGTLSSNATVSLWAKRNRCQGTFRSQSVDRVDDNTRAEIRRYTGCKKPLVYVLIEGHGHDWPGKGRRATRLQGPATKEVDATDLVWRFFSSL